MKLEELQERQAVWCMCAAVFQWIVASMTFVVDWNIVRVGAFVINFGSAKACGLVTGVTVASQGERLAILASD